MKREKGITLVSLVVTIIILIILAGVSINLTLGKNGIITMAKQAKENTELAKIEEETALNELYMQIETEGGTTGDISYDAIAKLTEFKTAIADYIEEAGGIKPETTADTSTFGESIKGILKEATKDATATAEDIAEGKTAYVNGQLVTGTTEFHNAANITQITTITVSVTSTSQRPTYTINNTSQYRYIIFINATAGGAGTSGTGQFYNFNCNILYNINNSCFILSEPPTSVTFQYNPNYTGSNTCYIYGIA